MIFKNHITVWHLKEGVKPLIGPDTESAEIKELAEASDEGRLIEASGLAASENQLQSMPIAENVPAQKAPIQDNNTEILSQMDDGFPLSSVSVNDSAQNGILNQKTDVQKQEAPSNNDESLNYINTAESFTDAPESHSGFMVDGCSVSDVERTEITEVAVIGRNTWMKLPYRLREKRADIFIDRQSEVDFVSSLAAFLESKGLKLRDYDDSVHYLPTDVLIVDRECLVKQGTVMYLQDGKRIIYNRLLKLFPDKLS